MKTERKSASSLSTRIEEKGEKRRALDGIRGLRRALARSQILLLVPSHRSQSTRPCFPSSSSLRYTPWAKIRGTNGVEEMARFTVRGKSRIKKIALNNCVFGENVNLKVN